MLWFIVIRLGWMSNELWQWRPWKKSIVNKWLCIFHIFYKNKRNKKCENLQYFGQSKIKERNFKYLVTLTWCCARLINDDVSRIHFINIWTLSGSAISDHYLETCSYSFINIWTLGTLGGSVISDHCLATCIVVFTWCK